VLFQPLRKKRDLADSRNLECDNELLASNHAV
jgi:hypothetical protein